jgi:hypothetical protein
VQASQGFRLRSACRLRVNLGPSGMSVFGPARFPTERWTSGEPFNHPQFLLWGADDDGLPSLDVALRAAIPNEKVEMALAHAGGNVRKGEHGTKVYFLKQLRQGRGCQKSSDPDVA